MKPTGIYTASVTPRLAGQTAIDMPAALDLIGWLCEHGVNGLVLMGSTGEFPHFGIEERSELAREAVKRSRVPVLVNVSHSSFDGALRLAREAADAGAAGCVLMPPYYFRYTQRLLFDFFQRFGEEFEGPLYLYNIPFFTTPLQLDTAKALLDTGRFSGIKDSSGDIDYLSQLLPYRSESTAVFVGNDAVFHTLRRMGADGVVSGVSCAIPELMVGLDRAITEDNDGKAHALDGFLQEFIRRIDALPAPIGVKEAAGCRGPRAGGHSIPFGPEMQREVAEFREWFLGWLPEVLRES